ncbi:MAG: CheR family methyltransferase [Polaromonas sp.]
MSYQLDAPPDPEELDDLTPSSINFPVVGMGASAGGLGALLRFFEHMPADNGMAFVLILHLSPQHESSVAEILQRVTKMPVIQVVASTAIEADHVYVIPPSHDLAMNDGQLQLVEPTRISGMHVAIDLFFRALAQVHKERAIAIVMSGTGTDGAAGLARIKERGGMTLAQSPVDAEYDGMPKAAIATCMVDFVLNAVDMPQRLLDLWANASRIRLPKGADPSMKVIAMDGVAATRLSEEALRDIMALLRSYSKNDFRHYKRATVLRRIERRLQVRGLPDLPAYRDYLREHAEEAKQLLQDMLISVTNFFRDRAAFEALERNVLPSLLENRLPEDPLRAWVAGCATGEEAYSIAILLREQLDLHHSTSELQVFATDIDERAISIGRNGLYPQAIMTDVSPGRLQQFFTREQDQFRVVKQLREKVLFAQHNVLRNPPFSRLDLVCCRNLLIYLDREAQTRVLEIFRFALKPGGYLFLGASESADAAPHLFTVVDKKNRIYKTNPLAHAIRHLPLAMDLPRERIAPARQKENRRESSLPPFAELHRKFIDQVVSPNLLIDVQHNVLHLSENVGKFLLPQLVVNQLENEIRQLKEHLQETIEQAETSTDELKASNEELQAINEELRSASEELETSKVELQSINEELTTVNFELKVKVDETSKVNDDLQNLITSTDIATVFIDRGMRIKRYTPQAVNIFSLIDSDLNRSLLDITHKLDYESLANDVAEVFKTLNMVERQVASCEGKHYLARIRPYRTTDDRIDGVVLTFVDVTALRRVEENLRAGEERLRIAAETTKDYAILTVDEEGFITTWNLGARRIFGYEEKEIVGQPFSTIFTPEDHAAGAADDQLRCAREDGRCMDERWHSRKDGSTFFCSGVVTRLEGKTGGYAKIARDMTESQTQQASREELLVREKEANELKDQFLAVMSHELKHPLNLIQVNTELLISQPEVRALPAVIRAGKTIRLAVASQTKIIDDLLDLSRARTGKLTLRLLPVELNELMSLIAAAARDAAAQKGLSLQYECDTEDVIALCDRVRTEQVFWNLINNAIKFTPDGGSISVKLTRDGTFAKFTVADTGRGIAPAFLPQVFGMFAQAPHQSSSSNSGLGVGLTLVHDLSVAQGGKVLAASAGLNKGATFTVWLPLAKNRAEDKKPAVSTGNLKDLRILVVDDMVELLEPFAALLRLEGAQVDISNSGQQALELLTSHAYDLMISDLGMPYMDGYELIRKVRKLPGLRRLKAIALSGYGRQVDTVRALQSGFNAHLAKPATVAHICHAIAQLVPKAEG